MAAKRYTVNYEHFENAMLAETNLAWQVFFKSRYNFSQERREKISRLMKRFVDELHDEVEQHKQNVQRAQREAEQAGRTAAVADANGASRGN